jgi:predicted permease
MLLRDIAYAIRILRKEPAFTAVVVISIALGIAANTTVFSAVNGVLLGVLPVRDPGSLYVVSGGNSFAYPDYQDYRRDCTGAFEGLAAHFPFAPANLAGSGTPERIWGTLVSGNYFSTVGVPLALGRGIAPGEDEVLGRDAVAVLGNGLWRKRFNADPAIAGKTVVLNARPYTVVGVAAPGFTGTDSGIISDFWAPLAMQAELLPELSQDRDSRTSYWLTINGRLRPGVSLEQAVAAMNVVNKRMHDTYRKSRRLEPITLKVSGGVPGERGMITGFLTLLMAVVGLVLLIACANVANLMLARAVGRQQEISIRLAVGASRGRLIRQLLVESVLLSLLGAACGFVLAFYAARALATFPLPIPFPIAFNLTPDLRVLAFTAALAVATGILFGLAPALAATRQDLISAIKRAAPGSGVFRSFGLRNLLVTLQVALSVVLLIGSGLFLRSLQRAASMDLGIRPENVLTLAVDPRANGYSEERLRDFLTQLDQRVTSLAGVRSMSAVDLMPLSFAEAGRQFSAGGRESGAGIFSVLPRYLETMGIPLLRGRDFDPARDLKSRSLIVSQTLARRLFGDQNPIGRTVRSGKSDVFEIIEVAGDAKTVTLGEDTGACAYLYLPRDAATVTSMFGLTILVKTTGNPARLLRPVHNEIEALDRNLAVFNGGTLSTHVARAFVVPRLCAILFGVFGAVGLTLACVGLYGVVSYSVRSRTREIGIRMALGAAGPAIMRLVLRQAFTLVAAGLAVGLVAAFAVSRFVASLLYGVSATDGVTFLAVPLVLAGAALLAAVVPARRACAVDPMRAVQAE